MKVKGAAVATLPMFVKENFKEEGLQKWLESLSEETRSVFKQPILQSSWFPLTQFLSEPTQKICELFYQNSMDGAWQCGRFSANHGLKGIYKVFIRIGSVQFLIKKASIILPTYYDPSELKLIESEDKYAIVHITKFPDADETIDHRIGGWIEKAIELSGSKNVKIQLNTSLSKGDQYTEIHCSWD